MLPCGLVLTQTGTGGDHGDDAGLVAVFGGRSAFDNLQRLDRIGGNLVRKDFTLLICDGLAIHGRKSSPRDLQVRETARSNPRQCQEKQE